MICVTAAGPVRDRATWSGTPASIANALEDIGVDVSDFTPVSPESLIGKITGSLVAARLGPGGRKFRHYFSPYTDLYASRWSELGEGGRNADALHTDTFYLTPSAREYFRSSSIFRDVAPQDHIAGFGIRGTLAQRIVAAQVSQLKWQDNVFVTSEWAKDRMADAGVNDERIGVVGAGIGFPPLDLSVTERRRKFENRRILCIAKVRFEQKGLDILLDAFTRLRKTDSSLELDLVTSKNAVAQGSPGVNVYSNVNFETLRRLYRESTLYVMPARYEPWGLVYSEALASGTPIIGTNRCAFPTIAESGGQQRGWILEAPEVDELVDAIRLAVSDWDSWLRRSMGGTVFARAESSWENVARKISSRISCGQP